jgi:hypothetical protein
MGQREHKSRSTLLLMGLTYEETLMKFKTIALATAFALSSTFAFAQGTGPATQQDNMTKTGTTNGSMDKGSMEKGTTGTGAGLNGAAAKPGGPDESKVGGQSTARKPPG